MIAAGASAKGNAQSASSATTGSTTTSASGSLFLVLVVTYNDTATISVTDSQSNTYSQRGSTIYDGANRHLALFECWNGTGGSGHTATGHISTGTDNIEVYLLEVLGAPTTSAAGFNSASTPTTGFNSNPTSSGTVSPGANANGTFLFSAFSTQYFSDTANISEANGFTIAQASNLGASAPPASAIANQVVTASGTYNASWSDGSTGSQHIGALWAYNGASGGGTPQPRTFAPGPGISPFAANQFRAPPLGYVLPVTPLAVSMAAQTGASGSLSSLQVSGGLGFVSQPGPGVGPFSNSQFQAAPLSIISPQPPFLMGMLAGVQCSFSLSVSQLQPIAMAGGAVTSMTADLSTQRTSGGSIGYLMQPGPGIGPLSRNQFVGAPRSTNALFQTATLASVSGAQESLRGALATGILLAFDIPGGELGIGTEGGDSIAIDPAHSKVVMSAALATAINLAFTPGAVSGRVGMSAALATGIDPAFMAAAIGGASLSLTSGMPVASSGGAVAQFAPSLATAIPLGSTSSGLWSNSFALGNVATVNLNASGIWSTSFSLGSVAGLNLAASGLVGMQSALGTGLSMAMPAAGIVSTAFSLTTSGAVLGMQPIGNLSAAATLGTSIALGMQPSGNVAATNALSSGLSLSLTAQGVMSAQGSIMNGPQFATRPSGLVLSSFALSTQSAPFAFKASAVGSMQSHLSGSIAMAAQLGFQSQLQVSLHTVLQPPGDFADVSWVRAPQSNPPLASGALPYAEFYQRAGEILWYGIVWEDWLANRWEPNTPLTVGKAIRPSTANGFQPICSTAGQTGATEPAWPPYVGGQVLDGSAVWTMAAIDNTSLEDTITSCAWNAASSAIALANGQITSNAQITVVTIDTTNGVAGTDYDVFNTIDTTDGQQKVGQIRIKVR